MAAHRIFTSLRVAVFRAGIYGSAVVAERMAWVRYGFFVVDLEHLRKCSHVPVSRPPRHDREDGLRVVPCLGQQAAVLCRPARDKAGWFASDSLAQGIEVETSSLKGTEKTGRRDRTRQARKGNGCT